MISYILHTIVVFFYSFSLLHLFHIIFRQPLPQRKAIVYIVLGMYSLLSTYTLTDAYHNLPSEALADIIALVYFSAKIWIYFIIFRYVHLKMGLLSIASIFIHSILHNFLKMRIYAISELHLTILSTLLEALIYFWCLWLIKRNNLEEAIAKYARKIKTYIYVLVIITVCLISLLGAMATFTFDTETTTNLIQLCTILLLVVISIVVANIVKIAISEQEKTELSELLTKQVENQVSYYERINEIYDEFCSFRHDFQNHVLCLQGILETNDIQQAKEYLSELITLFSGTQPKYNTGSVIIDALLNDKSTTAEKDNISIHFHGYIPTSGIHNVDLCTIFSNAIDNAIEACQKSDSTAKKLIQIKSDYRQGYYFLSFSNPIFEVIHTKKGRIITSKGNTTLHGYGIANITKAAKKYQGEVQISTKDNIFQLDVILLLTSTTTSKQ